MNTTKLISLVALQVLLGLSAFAATPFDCGSTGADGAWNITEDTTIALPPDGIFNCTSLTVAAGKTLRFTNNALNTPAYLLATGDVLINGAIDISGLSPSGSKGGSGGPGGFNGGNGGSVFAGQSQPSDGHEPGKGIYVTNILGNLVQSGRFASVYGNLLCVPLIGGSGGAGEDMVWGNRGGGGGGGAILIASNNRITVAGSILARGDNPPDAVDGAGSGGAIRLVSPWVGGTGSLDSSKGGNSGGGYQEYGGPGRIRIDCQDNQAYRTLALSGLASRGSQMYVFPTAVPALDIIAVGGQTIAGGTNNAVVIELAIGASTNQTVLIQARNFTNDVPIRVVVTPESGPSSSFDATILQGSGNPPSATVPVIIPAGSACQVNAWTR